MAQRPGCFSRQPRTLRAHRYDLEVHGMIRQNLLSDAWDGDDEEDGTRRRIFWRPDYARMGATLYELAPGAPGIRMHMHFGAEEMFFVLERSSRLPEPTRRRGAGSGRFRLLPRGTCRTSRVQQPHRRTRPDPRDQRRELPGRRCLPRTRICMGGDPRSRSRAARERRRPRHHRSLRDPDRVDRSGACRPTAFDTAGAALPFGQLLSYTGEDTSFLAGGGVWGLALVSAA